MRFAAVVIVALLVVAACSGGATLRRAVLPPAGKFTLFSDRLEISVEAAGSVAKFFVIATNGTDHEIRLIRYRVMQRIDGREWTLFASSIPRRLKPGEVLTINDTGESIGQALADFLAMKGKDGWTSVRELDYLDADGKTNTARTELRFRWTAKLPEIRLYETDHFSWYVARELVNTPEAETKLSALTNWMERVHDMYLESVGAEATDAPKVPIALVRRASLLPKNEEVGCYYGFLGEPFISVAWEAADTPWTWGFALGDAYRGLGRYILAHEYAHYRLMQRLPSPPFWFVEAPAIWLGMQALEADGETAMRKRTADRMEAFEKEFRDGGNDASALFAAPFSDYGRLNWAPQAMDGYGYLVQMLLGLEKTSGGDFLRSALDKMQGEYENLPEGKKSDPAELNRLFRAAITETGGKPVLQLLQDYGYPSTESETNR